MKNSVLCTSIIVHNKPSCPYIKGPSSAFLFFLALIILMHKGKSEITDDSTASLEFINTRI